ncbi:para-aminobenzoate synthase [Dothidotthia symphoricarpi CBS 119687]|uniref:aminodeoxychorismate synthase n=1 Tax=Dothidotthia symphoricarpi CBS 119687 TaxID=1392245 RepID=A0A6A6AA91_9PLEO|nr:para-aminobenzoate synthase [Dothidotthia symphoricarpi CBS 119687]KAF2128842.1 para-aminobenzoate synthase [Dothidotthia symphoricarpi CBS 119687]
MSLKHGTIRAAHWVAVELGLKTMRSARKDVYIIILSRYLRMFAYGAVALILAVYFQALGFSDEQIGFFMTLTLLGDVVISLLLTLIADSLGRRKTLLLGALAMALSGTVFATTSNYGALLVSAIVGVISPTGTEIGPFRAVEESTLAHLVDEQQRSDVYTWYVVLAVLGTSTGLVVGGLAVDKMQGLDGWTELDAYRAVFWIYTGVGLLKAIMALCLSQQCEHVHEKTSQSESPGETEPLLSSDPVTQDTAPSKPTKNLWNPINRISKPSRGMLIKFCSLFFFDALGSGMVPFSLINFYMERKFSLPKGKLGGIMSATWVVSTIGNVFAASLAKRLGLIQAMVATHFPSSVFLAALPIANGLPLTICLLVGRSVLSSMDQAPRSAFLSIVVLPEERTAVMGVVNIVRTLAQSGGPSITGVLAGRDRFWLAFLVAGALKVAYDVMLLAFFGGNVHPRAVCMGEESDSRDDRPISTRSQLNGSWDTPSRLIETKVQQSLATACEQHLSLVAGPCIPGQNTPFTRRSWTMAPAIMTQRPKILFLDAYDSFSNNIVALVEQNVEADVVKVFIDEPSLVCGQRPTSPTERSTRDTISFRDYLKDFDAVIAGPGPGWAKCDTDVGLMKELWKLQDEDMMPVLGVCLGFQSLCLAFGAEIEKLEEPKHGIITDVLHNRQSIFRDVEKLLATQYHSLQVMLNHPIQTKRAVRYPAQLWESTATCPQLEPLAWDFDSERNGAVLMGVKHIQKPFWGVQFHPESICTNSEGSRIIRNWWEDAQSWNRKRMFSHVAQKSSLSPFRAAPMTFSDFRREFKGYGADNQATCSLKGVVGKANSGISESEYPRPKELAVLVAHGDGISIPDLSPEAVHCSTTGSGRLTVADVCELLEIQRREAIVLQSGLQSNLVPMAVGTGRYSIIGLVIPGETLRLHYYTRSRIMQLRDGRDRVHTEWKVADPWPYIKEVMEYLRPATPPRTSTWAPFWGGLMGYASYEAGLQTIDVPADGVAEHPDICFAYITRSIVFDHQVKKVYVQSIRGAHDNHWVEQTVQRIYEAAGSKSAETTPSGTPVPKPDPFEKFGPMNQYIDSCVQSSASREEYCDKVRSCQDAIADGQSYELCLTTRNEIRAKKPNSCRISRAECNEHSWNLYKRLTGQNPAPFSAYMRMHNVHILSSSPERFISWDRSQTAQCRPIKGTVQKKLGVTAEDAHAILSSSKERAENLMIVDLTRHQLHGVYGSANVCVSQLMEMEEYETVWQLTTVVDATPSGASKPKAPGEWEDPTDYVSASGEQTIPYLGFQAFVESLPPGSMTGAPKKRSCELLQNEEAGQRRGIYSGVLGYLDVGGGGDFSVVIRTAIKIDSPDNDKEDVWRIGAGGAVTSQSTPDGEYEEMLVKFQSTARAFKHQPPPPPPTKKKIKIELLNPIDPDEFEELLLRTRDGGQPSLEDAQIIQRLAMATDAPDPRTFQTWEDAFQYPIPVVRKLEQQLRTNADDNREKLRSLVGASYRSLLDTAETIIDMEVCMQQVESKLARVFWKRLLIWDTDVERYTFASQLAILRNAPTVMTRLIKRDGSYLLVAKVLVVSRLLHKALSQSKDKPPIVEQSWERLLSVRRKLLRRIDKRLASTSGETATLVESMSAYALVTSSTPTDVLQHFHKVRMEKVTSALKQGDDELAKHGVGALQICIQTCLDTQTIFPRRLAESLVKLKAHPLIQDPDVRGLYELNLEVHDRWIGDEARNYTPWPRHDELQRADAERILHRWSKDAISAFLQEIKTSLEGEDRLKEVASLRQELIETWILSGSRMAGVKSANVLDDLRDTMNEKLESIVRSRTQGLQDVVSSLKSQLDVGTPSSDSSSLSLWNTTAKSSDLSNGAQVFKATILNTHQGRDQPVMNVLSAFDKWMDSVLEVKGIVKGMKEARWDDTFADDVDDASDDELGESKQTLLSADDPRLLEEVTQEALSDALNSLGQSFSQIAETSIKVDDKSSVEKAAFILRVVREIGDRIPRLRLQDKSSPLASPFTSKVLQPLYTTLATYIVPPTVASYEKALLNATKAKPQSVILWEGNPPLPSQPSASAFRFLRELNKSMARVGSDLWAPGSASILKSVLAQETRKALQDHIQTIKVSNKKVEKEESEEPTDTPASPQNAAAPENVEHADGSVKERQGQQLKQLLFDALYIQRFTGEKKQSIDDLVEKIELEALDEAAVNRLRKNAADYAKKTYLLFALLA